MIGNAKRGAGFSGLQEYLLHGKKDEPEVERAAWVETRNLSLRHVEDAAAVMRATANQSDRTQYPVYHLSLSAAHGESFPRERWNEIADRVLRDLKLDEHQALLVLHQDKDHEHLHLMVNRVHPETGVPWKGYNDWKEIEWSLRRIEREYGLREVPGHHGRFPDQPRPDRSRGLTSDERHFLERQGRQAQPARDGQVEVANGVEGAQREELFVQRLRREVAHHFEEAQGWTDLAARLGEHGLRVEAKGRGLVVTDGEREAKASRIARTSSRAHLEERFGPFREWKREFDELQNLLGHAEDGAAVGRKIEKVAKGIERARGAVTRHEEAREGRAALTERAEHLVPRVVAEKDLPRAREQLRAALEPAARGGLQELRPESLAARLEAGQPALGPLRGRQWAGFESPERRAAVAASRNLAEVLRQLPAAQDREARAAGPARGATRRLPALEARAEELANLRYQHRPTEALLTRVRDLAIRVIEREARKSLGAELSLFQALRSAALGSVWRTVQGKAMAGLSGPLSPGLELLSFALKIGRAMGRERE